MLNGKVIIGLLVTVILILAIGLISSGANPLADISHYLSHMTMTGLKIFGIIMLILLGIITLLAIIASIMMLLRSD